MLLKDGSLVCTCVHRQECGHTRWRTDVNHEPLWTSVLLLREKNLHIVNATSEVRYLKNLRFFGLVGPLQDAEFVSLRWKVVLHGRVTVAS